MSTYDFFKPFHGVLKPTRPWLWVQIKKEKKIKKHTPREETGPHKENNDWFHTKTCNLQKVFLKINLELDYAQNNLNVKNLIN